MQGESKYSKDRLLTNNIESNQLKQNEQCTKSEPIWETTERQTMRNVDDRKATRPEIVRDDKHKNSC